MPVPLTQHAAPLDDTRRFHGATLIALRDAVARSADFWRHSRSADAPVPGLTWTAAETAAHLVADLADYTDALTRAMNGQPAVTAIGSGSPARRSAAVSASHLTTVGERDLRALADMLEEEAIRYLAVAAEVDDTLDVPTSNGLVLNPPTMTSLLLGEQLVHGVDIARAQRTPWPVARHDALLVLPGVLAVMPRYLRPSQAHLRISYELRIRGGGRYRLSVRDGTAEITAAGDKVDCVITADPAAFLLLGYGRIPQWAPVIRGKLRAGGRKPWLAMKFGTLFSRP